MPERIIPSIHISGARQVAIGYAADFDRLERLNCTCRVGNFVDRLK